MSKQTVSFELDTALQLSTYFDISIPFLCKGSKKETCHKTLSGEALGNYNLVTYTFSTKSQKKIKEKAKRSVAVSIG